MWFMQQDWRMAVWDKHNPWAAGFAFVWTAIEKASKNVSVSSNVKSRGFDFSRSICLSFCPIPVAPIHLDYNSVSQRMQLFLVGW